MESIFRLKQINQWISRGNPGHVTTPSRVWSWFVISITALWLITYTGQSTLAKQVTDHNPLFPITDENGKYGYVDQTGQIVVPPQYDNADRFFEGRAMIQQDNVWGFLDATGQEIVPPQYESVNIFTEGLAAVLVDGKWGAIDLEGQMVIEPQFDAPPAFRDGWPIWPRLENLA